MDPSKTKKAMENKKFNKERLLEEESIYILIVTITT